MDKDKIIQSLLKLLQKNNSEIINLNIQIDDLTDKLNAAIAVEKKEKDEESNIYDKTIGMNLQKIDNGFTVLFTTIEKKTIEEQKNELLEKKRELDKVLRIKDNVYELERDLLEKNKKLEDKMVQAFNEVHDVKIKQKIRMRIASFMVGIDRVERSYSLRGG